MLKTFTITDTTKPPRTRRQKFDDSGWVRGRIEQYTYEAKAYEIGSEWGIHESNVSKLFIYDEAGRELVAYDRGWVTLPEDAELCEMVDALVEFYAPRQS